MNFNCSYDDEGLRILQLRKWAPSEFQYNPLDFREGFLSPTREFLLLLSYNFEALLFPLVKGSYLAIIFVLKFMYSTLFIQYLFFSRSMDEKQGA